MAAAAASSSSVSSLATSHAFHRLLRPPTPSFPSFSCTPLSAAFFTGKPLFSEYQKSTQLHNSYISSTPFSFLHSSFSSLAILFSRSSSTSALISPPNALNPSLSIDEDLQQEDEGEEEDDDGEIESDEEDTHSGRDKLELEDNAVSISVADESPKQGLKREGVKVPKLSVKEKKELASYAHGLGKKLKSQLVGKSGVTDNVATSFIETLEANELLKIKIHRTCPGELEDVVERLEEATGSVVVSKIGRTVIIYRPSISKMKAEEKKNQERRVHVRKDSRFNPGSQRGQVQRLTGRGRRGSSRI